MGIAESMKSLAENIYASFDARVKAVDDLVADTHVLLKGFASDRRKMGSEQAESLKNFVKDLAKNVDDTLKGFKKNRKQMSERQTKNLVEFVKNLTKDMGSMIKGFNKDRKEMSDEVKDKLTKEVKGIQTAVKDIVNNAQKLIGEYRSDMGKARHIWQGMASTLAKSREEGVMPEIEAGEGEEAKPKKKMRKKKRGKK